ncbi:MAG: DUF3048 domain-containing protein [Eubacterium sp.]|nr:DUF3048 domain-containing protein [Eubacterium sp.]
MAVIAIACGVYFGCFYNKEEETTTTPPSSSTTTEAAVIITNPLTGETGYNEAAVGKRPISVVIDNASGARPQYNMSAADLVVEGEVEGGETRMLWFFADMANLPEQVGPTRSARPSFVQFSELFDSVYVHFGGSHSKGDYIGGYEVIKQDNFDDIDGMSVSSCFKRTSDKASPHNAVLIGENLVAAIEKKNYRTDIEKSSFSALSFNEKVSPVSEIPCNNATVKISSKTRSHTWAYNSESKTYSNQKDYGTPISFTNLIIMYADSTYIDKHDYKGAGNTETYLNYSLTSGSGQLISCGTVVDFDWSVDNGILSFKDKNGSELKFNSGKSWIALTSANHNGSVTVE